MQLKTSQVLALSWQLLSGADECLYEMSFNSVGHAHDIDKKRISPLSNNVYCFTILGAMARILASHEHIQTVQSLETQTRRLARVRIAEIDRQYINLAFGRYAPYLKNSMIVMEATGKDGSIISTLTELQYESSARTQDLVWMNACFMAELEESNVCF